jgi:hypothetical protein
MPDPNVRDLLLADLDELVEAVDRALDAVSDITEQLEPERAQSCRIVENLVRVMLEEIRLRAHARPLDKPEPS